MTLNLQAHDKLVAKLAERLQIKNGLPAQTFRTHISSVVVCGEFAYKLKRPVKLPFVDFSSLSLRKQDCHRELQINQRTAPTLYLGVVKITGSLDAPRLGGRDKAIDWAVKMRRFEQTALLSHQIKRDAISSQTAQKLGQHLGEFANELPRLKRKSIQKHRPTIKWLLESLVEIGGVFSAEQRVATNIEAWAKQQAGRLGLIIKKRQREGFFRDCHGDLHLGNLLKSGHKVIAFDALEFNQELRQIDIVNDVAFAFMDFLAFNRPDLAWAMVNQWCEKTGDYAGLSLLRYFTLYRAVVRAKVAALTVGSRETATFHRYWSLAQRLIEPANPPRLVLVAGLSGSGKSTVARELVSALSGIQVRADVIRKQLFADRLNNPEKLYAKEATQKTYQQLARIADQLLGHNMTVIVDATFLSKRHINQFNKLAQARGLDLQVIHCHAPAPVLSQRIKRRARRATDPSDATVAVLKTQIERLKLAPIDWPAKTWNINTDDTIANVTNHIHQVARKLLA